MRRTLLNRRNVSLNILLRIYRRSVIALILRRYTVTLILRRYTVALILRRCTVAPVLLRHGIACVLLRNTVTLLRIRAYITLILRRDCKAAVLLLRYVVTLRILPVISIVYGISGFGTLHRTLLLGTSAYFSCAEFLCIIFVRAFHNILYGNKLGFLVI